MPDMVGIRGNNSLSRGSVGPKWSARPGRMDRVWDGSQQGFGRSFAFSRPHAPEVLCGIRVPRVTEGAGKAGRAATPAASRGNEKTTRVSHYRYRRIRRPSLRDGLRLSACSPRCPCPFSHRRPQMILCRLSTSLGVPGPHAFAVRICPARHATQLTSIAFHPAFVAIAIRPSLAWNPAIIVLIWGFSQQHFRKSELRQVGTTGNLRIARMRSLLDVFPWLVGQISDCGFGARSTKPTLLGLATHLPHATYRDFCSPDGPEHGQDCPSFVQ